jgi:Domain of unknown function (DUF5664)/Cytidine and deoxycytidylate deaminase zinc-binding region
MSTTYTKQEILDLLPGIAEISPCVKRKVAAIVAVEKGGQYTRLGSGFNYNPDGTACEIDGVTKSSVIHAEVAAIDVAKAALGNLPLDGQPVIFVTHPPCENCLSYIDRHGITLNNEFVKTKIEIAETFLKFDTSKTRFDLVPTTLIKSVAEVLTYGAKKYKPNNWQKVDDHSRYVAALYRHLEAWRAGEENDPESGLSHLAHAATNISFLIHLKAQGNKNN